MKFIEVGREKNERSGVGRTGGWRVGGSEGDRGVEGGKNRMNALD